ncbi:U4/U6.U5 tri-snRNP-associated protein 1 [Lingula anatina]|uniref:U4/U6.U5 tri-snRNP-associated protein 1 n=1 Tax=Lingula anatina TaxID=7574 RepID=A0A2R2MNM6_LINAN|nr:U4/U6.U5 tri-snRNP-associated protein 1 [Lingula anatina]|eukprot:XP_023931823.1 U4/U6.U5 tri-snRNP-associated protein 1 [Lingula anatina]
MGSSKKHKERDREREHKRKHKHRSRSRSRSPREKKRRHRDRSHSRDKETGYSKDVEGRSEIYEEELKIKEEPSDDIKPKSSGGDISLSIEETNKLRAKLGLKPLEVPDENEPKEEKESLKDDIHKPAGNIAQAQMTEKLKEKLAVIKEKRRINMQLGKVKTLGESDSDDESAATWVKRNRKDAEEKKMAEKRAKMLEEMDAEFGIGNLVEEEFAPLMNKGKEYTSRDLKGIKVEHGMGSFKEGKAVILTLKDKGILDEDDEGDTLVNVNIVDDERSKKNVENKKKKPDYKPWDEPEYDEYGMLKTTNILDKYDEEIDGEKRDAFTLGSGGKYDGEHEKNMEKIRAQLRQQGQSLSLAAPNIASEYYTQEEMR